ncbi:hypothetical protein KFE25_003799 [Diacronema lutheri]|uniref:FAD dependent oxidoreductase domain-containing protein n=1 Tax=Diacronema lutheri TaxID=2081491 RepID=A0A8J5X8E8_DIALT|nr:hypothetical protein KFE25_003799 [Diacronema lutheri]
MAAGAAIDVCVIGGGIVGVATAWRSALRGRRTLLLERFGSVLHTRGSSHGRSRIIRRTYPQDVYTRAMADAYAFWRQAEAEAGVQLITTTGGIDLGAVGNPGLAAIVRGCERFGVPHERLRADEVHARFPLLRPPDGYEAVFSPEGGVLDADAARESLLALALRASCELRTGATVVDVAADGAGGLRVDVAVDGGAGARTTSVHAASVVLAAGAWTPALLRRCTATRHTAWAALPLALKKVRSMLWRPRGARACALVGSTPAFIDYSTDMPVYGMPDPSGLLKLATHDGPLFADADARDEQDDEASALAVARAFIRRCVPDLDASGAPERVEHCVYTMTPDEDFVLDAMPVGQARLVLGSSCSGHGFKLAPWTGEALACLATGEAGARSWHAAALGALRADRAFGSFDAPLIMGQQRGPSTTSD